MPNPNTRARDDAMRLLTLLREVRAAKPDARDFALFDRRDALNALGAPYGQIDGFDATDDAALDAHIANARAVATTYGAPEDDDHSALWAERGREMMQGGAGDDRLGVTTVKAPPLASPLLPEIPWPKNGPTWTPYNPTRGILPEPLQPVAPPKPALPGTPQERALLDAIAAAEIDEMRAKTVGFASAYDTPYNYGQFVRPPKPLTQMTIAEVKDFQRQTREAQRGRTSIVSEPMGRYQIMPGTLAEAQVALGLADGDLFMPEVQDRIALDLLKKRHIEDFRSGKIDAAGFQNQLAQEWAAVPTTRGVSHYKDQSARVPSDKIRAAILNLKGQ